MTIHSALTKLHKQFLWGFLFFLMLACTACSQKQEDKQCALPTSYQDLKGHKVAVLTGSLQDLLISDIVEESNILRLTSPAELIASVEQGVTSYTAIDEICILNVDMKKRGLTVAFTDSVELAGDAAMVFNKENTTLCQQYNEFFKKLKEDGTYDEIIKRWSTKRIDTVTVPDFPQVEGEPIRVATMGSDMPLSFIKDNKWAGIEVEILQHFGQYLGRPVEFQNYEFSASIAALNSKRVDIVSMFIFITEERKKSVMFSDPYFHASTICIAQDKVQEAEQAGFIEKIKTGFQRNFLEEDRWKMLIDGLWETLVISFWSLIFGTILGAGLCALRMSKRKGLQIFAKAYISIMRGVPILVFLMIMFYVIFAKSKVSGSWIAIFAFSLNLAAYVSEMFRTGIASVDKGQTEAGRAMGFSAIKTFILIVVPQAVKQILPVYKGEAVSLIKNTSIVGFIAIQDLTKVSDIIRSRTFDAFYPLIVISIIYFILAWFLGMLLDYAHKKTIK